jgi:hypothetical protein
VGQRTAYGTIASPAHHGPVRDTHWLFATTAALAVRALPRKGWVRRCSTFARKLACAAVDSPQHVRAIATMRCCRFAAVSPDNAGIGKCLAWRHLALELPDHAYKKYCTNSGPKVKLPFGRSRDALLGAVRAHHATKKHVKKGRLANRGADRCTWPVRQAPLECARNEGRNAPTPSQ